MSHPEDEVDLLYEQITSAVQGKDVVFILGDFNAVIGRREAMDGMLWHGGFSLEEERNARGRKLATWTSSMDFILANTLFMKEAHRTATHVRGRFARVIDYIMVKRVRWVEVVDCEVEDDFAINSDHRLLSCSLIIAGASSQQSPPSMRRMQRKENKKTLKHWKPVNEDQYCEEVEWWSSFWTCPEDMEFTVGECAWLH